MKNTLFLIPARGGSKGIPGKNIKLLGGKPLIIHSVDFARQFTTDDMICVSTDSQEIIKVVESHNLSVPFVRPAELATDAAGSYEVILHAIDAYEKKGTKVETVVLLQPTSPFRLKKHLDEAFSLYSYNIDMVTSVKKVKSNVYSTFYCETPEGFIEKAFGSASAGIRRQDSETLYELNGSIYIMNVASLRAQKPGEFKRTRKVVMEEVYSADIDEPADWLWCEFLIEKGLV